jgi:hypothetical protein
LKPDADGIEIAAAIELQDCVSKRIRLALDELVGGEELPAFDADGKRARDRPILEKLRERSPWALFSALPSIPSRVLLP